MPPPPLPTSLSPHVLVVTSPDLDQLFSETRQLPPLHQLLQSFCPLQQVTTRTSALTPVTHANFNLRFSSLADVEEACEEDEDTRAERTMDWIGSRIAQQAAGWMDNPRMVEHERWWTELRACVEGERAPVRGEGWNHPVALIFATSTLAPNPLQAISALHARIPDLPPWVDQIMLKYTLIVHPTPSNLDPNEAVALLNAVKKQFGLNTHLLQLPSLHDKTKFEVPIPLPQLPSISSQTNQKPGVAQSMTLHMSELDAQNVGRFVREFATSALIPWMERSVADWNEAFNNARRISTRIFGSTARRFFGSTSSIPTPPSSTSSPIPGSPTTATSPTSSTFATLPPHRRLAEFSTILGDYKLATSVWDVLRKETPQPPSSYLSRAVSNGSDVLPLIIAPGAAMSLHANAALGALGMNTGVSVGAAAQVRALVYAVRWEVGVNDFHGEGVDGERWLAMAAGAAEEPTSALLLGRAASIGARKGATRRAALWFAMAGKRLEKSGIKPLTIHFFEQANEARAYQKESLYSPSFFEILEGSTASKDAGLTETKLYLDHALGRLKYLTGDTLGAVTLFSGLLRPVASVSPLSIGVSEDLVANSSKMYCDDFRDALEHYISTHSGTQGLENLHLPVQFSQPRRVRTRLVTDDTNVESSSGNIDEYWTSFCRSRGQKGAKLDTSRTALVGESFWLSVTFQNPLSAEVTLTNVTPNLAEKNGSSLLPPSSSSSDGASSSSSSSPPPDASTLPEVETLAQITLPPKGQVVVSFRITPRQASGSLSTLSFPSISFLFLGLLPCTESLATRGRRLNDTPAQRQGRTYAPDTPVQIDVREAGARLATRFVPSSLSSSGRFAPPAEGWEEEDEEEIGVFDGEIRRETLLVRNTGDREVSDVWLVLPSDGAVWLDRPDADEDVRETLELPAPYHLDGVALKAGESTSVPITMRHMGEGPATVSVLVVFRENESSDQYFVTRAHRSVWIQPIVTLSAAIQPAPAWSSSQFSLMLEVENIAGPENLSIDHISTTSSTWTIHPSSSLPPGFDSLPRRQIARGLIDLDVVPNLDVAATSRPLEDLSRALTAVLDGGIPINTSPIPETVPLVYGVAGHDRSNSGPSQALSSAEKHFIQSSRRMSIHHLAAAEFPSIPSSDYPHIFPTYTPIDMDVALSWSIPASSSDSAQHSPQVSSSGSADTVEKTVSTPSEPGDEEEEDEDEVEPTDDLDKTMTLTSPPITQTSFLPTHPPAPQRDAFGPRRGLISLADAGDLLSVGARHGALRSVLALASGEKKGRTMYAETAREREVLIQGVRECRWNEDRCPIDLFASVKGGEGAVVHDFENGPCPVPVSFVLRNESTTLSAKVTLRLRSPPPKLGTPSIKFVGSLVKRGMVPPAGRIELSAKALTTSPGRFQVHNWELITSVGREGTDGQWVEHSRYVETDVGDPLRIEVLASLEPLLF